MNEIVWVYIIKIYYTRWYGGEGEGGAYYAGAFTSFNEAKKRVKNFDVNGWTEFDQTQTSVDELHHTGYSSSLMYELYPHNANGDGICIMDEEGQNTKKEIHGIHIIAVALNNETITDFQLV